MGLSEGDEGCRGVSAPVPPGAPSVGSRRVDLSVGVRPPSPAGVTAAAGLRTRRRSRPPRNREPRASHPFPCEWSPAAGRLRRCSRVFATGTLQEAVGQQEPVGEELSHTLHLEEVVQETGGEWQALANVF